MKVKKKKLSGYDINKKYYWSPAIHWKKNCDEVIIEETSLTGIASEIFPEFYYKTQDGITPANLIEEFSSIESKDLEEFIKDLIREKILVSSILDPEDVFRGQAKVFNSKYSEETFFNPKESKKFKELNLNRKLDVKLGKKIEFEQKEEYPEIISGRRTFREFDKSKKISRDTFGQLLSSFRQIRKDEEIWYYYASGGGLYPIDIYIYVKDDRVEDIHGGLYYYSPIDNSISLVSNSLVITEDAHFYTNKEIYNSSAFSIFFIYNAEVTMPKYGGMAYFYGGIDTGLMIGVLTSAAELNNIGLCSIGNMNFNRIKKYFKLNENQVLLHTVEGGLKTDK